MAETIKFDLTSRMAIIKKPESNETYYTYHFPHKIMLLGILGAIIGLNGYNYYALKKYLGEPVEELPEFYSKLKSLKIGIVPKREPKDFHNKIQVFNNSVGYASEEIGNNLVVKEQWLENPYWEIYILKDHSEEYQKIRDYLVHKKCEYIPYIGKNDHFANIKNVEITSADIQRDISHIDSIFQQSILSQEMDPFEDMLAWAMQTKVEYNYQEILPTKLSEKIGYCYYEPFVFTNQKLEIIKNTNLYKVGDKIIYYF